MARLTEPPRKRLTNDFTPPPSLSYASTDTDAATQQLLAETRASASKLSTPPQSSAVLGANLLNAARVDFRHSSPVRIARKAGNGRLSRVGYTEPRRQNLARPRDVYDLPESPEKRAFKLSETVNQKPLRVMKKSKKTLEASGPEPDQRQANYEGQHDTVDDLLIPSSPPKLTPEADDDVDTEGPNVQVDGHLENGAVRCAVISYRSDKPAGPRYEQCRNAGKMGTHDGPRCSRHVNKSGSLRCEYIMDTKGDALQCRAVGIKGTTRCGKHAGLDNPPGSASPMTSGQELALENNMVWSSAKRRPEEGRNVDSRPSKSPKMGKHAVAGHKTKEDAVLDINEDNTVHRSDTKSDSKIHIPVRKSRKHTSKKQDFVAEDYHEGIADSIEVNAPTQSQSGGQAKSKAQATSQSIRGKLPGIKKKSGKSTSATMSSKETQTPDFEPDGESHEQFQDAEGEDEDGVHGEGLNADESTDDTTHTPRALIRVFKFLKFEKRSGSCQTELCVRVKRVCDRTYSIFRGDSLSVEGIIEKMNEVRAVIKQTRKVNKEYQLEVKEDMYCYVFRALTKVLKSLHICLMERYNDITGSLDAMRIFCPFVRDILALKHILDSWKVKVPQRYTGDRVVQSVISQVITPLREVEKTFGSRLALLEDKERKDQQLARLRRQVEDDEKEAQRIDEAFTAGRKRWDRWQQLHITRMQCEPDPRRRRRLLIPKREDVEETDANGARFERVPIFTKRNAPSPHWALSLAEERHWSEGQEEALLEGLRVFAGSRVFHKIFDTYCRAGGLLREFSVIEIVLKANWVRSSYQKLQQDKGWDVPAWIEQIPVLP